MPTPAAPVAVAIAAMVSRELMRAWSQKREGPPPGRAFGPVGVARLFGGDDRGARFRLVAVALADDPLLQQAQDAVGAPVQHQAGREEGHHHAEYQRHEGHYLLLH